AGGVPAGANRTTQAEASKSRMVSEIAGTSGKAAARVAEVTAMARIDPALRWPGKDGRPSTPTCTSPAITACVAGAPPRNGTWVIVSPAAALINSITRCDVLPAPEEAWFSLPGLALA